MNKIKYRMLIVGTGICLLTGGGREDSVKQTMETQNAVDKVLNSQTTETDSTETETVGMWQTEKTTEMGTMTEAAEAGADGVDVDLTVMGSDMVYATVFQMMSVPDQYIGKRVRMKGNHYGAYGETAGRYFHYCVIKDAMACCQQGIEFMMGDTPDTDQSEYPENNTDIIVEGTFETYTVENDENVYCRLANATWKLQENQ